MKKVQAQRAGESSPAVQKAQEGQEAQEARKAEKMQEIREAQVAPKVQSTQSPPAQPAQPDLELVLVRHGYTQWNQERRYLGWTDVPLAPGEAERLERLRTQPQLTGDFSRVYCSDLLRCRETLAALVPHLKQDADYDPRLREMDFGTWEGSTYDQLKDNPLYRSWIDNPEAATPPGGEEWAKFAARIDDFWTGLQQEAEAPSVTRILLVTHGGVIRQLLARIIEGVTFYTAAAPAPGEVMVLCLQRDGGSWRMVEKEC